MNGNGTDGKVERFMRELEGCSTGAVAHANGNGQAAAADEVPFWLRAAITPKDLAALRKQVAEQERELSLARELADQREHERAKLAETARAVVNVERQVLVEALEALGTYEHLVFWCDGSPREEWETYVAPVLAKLRLGVR